MSSEQLGFTRFDSDPEALAWARAHVEEVRDKYRSFAQSAEDVRDHDRMERARLIANVIDRELIGGEGCVITAFDHRKPDIGRALTGEADE